MKEAWLGTCQTSVIEHFDKNSQQLLVFNYFGSFVEEKTIRLVLNYILQTKKLFTKTVTEEFLPTKVISMVTINIKNLT